jgi:membrane protein DedA with SNARE-associated domain
MTEQPSPGPVAASPAGAVGPVLPWQGQAQRADKLILALMAFSGIYYLVTTPLVAPLVGHHPVWLALIRGSATAVITLGAMARTGHSSLVVAVLAGLPGTVLFDWIFWWAGRRWGDNALTMMFQRGRNPAKRIDRVKRLAHRYGALAVVTGYIIPIPVQLIAMTVGLGGMPLAVYVILDIIGALIWLGLLAGLGYWIGQGAINVANAVSHYSLWVTVGLMIVIMIRQSRSSRGRGRKSTDAL